MRACLNCQAALSDDAKCCPNCGANTSPGLLARLGSLFGVGPGIDSQSSPRPTPPGTPAVGPETSFGFTVEDVFSIKGRGTIVTGRIASGRVAVGDQLAFRSPNGNRVVCRVEGIEMFRKITNRAQAGDNAGLLLSDDVRREDLARGIRLERA